MGDGFKFLDDYKNAFDVIITDSSDPEGPAESLFQKPYFELLFGALREGGVITTQGCTFSFISVDLVILSCVPIISLFFLASSPRGIFSMLRVIFHIPIFFIPNIPYIILSPSYITH